MFINSQIRRRMGFNSPLVQEEVMGLENFYCSGCNVAVITICSLTEYAGPGKSLRISTTNAIVHRHAEKASD